jgi:ERCC4-type nuclease
MVKHWTEADLVAALSDLKIIADSREQVNNHITEYWDRKKVPYFTRKLDVGDYSAQLGDYTLEHDIAVERKHNLDEICGNLTQDRDRFEREFLRAKANGTKVFLLIEDSGWQDIYLHNYRSRLSPKSLMASLMSWQVRFNITVWFCEKENTARLIHQILYYAAREQLLNGW